MQTNKRRVRIKRKYIPILITMGIAVLMFITNPGEKHFKSFLKKQLVKRNFPEKDIEESIRDTKITDYILFSQYNFKIKDYNVPMEGSYIGAFNFFISVGNFTVDDSE